MTTTTIFVPPPEICTNGKDDDADLLVDCKDPDCVGALRRRATTWFFQFKAYGDLSGATDPDMNLQLQLGDQGFISNAVWEPTRRGWRAVFKNLHRETGGKQVGSSDAVPRVGMDK